jgi:hypothetical protein
MTFLEPESVDGCATWPPPLGAGLVTLAAWIWARGAHERPGGLA